MTPLGHRLVAQIANAGPMPLAQYMQHCLSDPQDGYYPNRDPLGASGDFTTAPEVSQMFGEIIGAWLAQVWSDQGAPADFTLAELGPGRGTLMHDALRVIARLPDMRAAAHIVMVETSPVLRAAQAERLEDHGPVWVEDVRALPERPLFVIANEFFDALPIDQYQRIDMMWRQRLVAVEAGHLTFVWSTPRASDTLDKTFGLLPDGAIAEINPLGSAIVGHLAERIAARGGAALIVDYGRRDGYGDTFQAVEGHECVDPLARPGLADLTAHVDFGALVRAAGEVAHYGPQDQGAFLERLGIAQRAQILARGRDAATQQDIAEAYRRLTHPDQMGHLFKAIAFLPKTAPPPAGFDAS